MQVVDGLSWLLQALLRAHHVLGCSGHLLHRTTCCTFWLIKALEQAMACAARLCASQAVSEYLPSLLEPLLSGLMVPRRFGGCFGAVFGASSSIKQTWAVGFSQ